MATNGITSTSSYALGLILNFVIVGIATRNVNAGSYDHLNNSKQSVFSKQSNNASRLPDFEGKLFIESTTPRKRVKSEASKIRDEDMANEESEWDKEMGEISPGENEKWMKYPTENPESLNKTKKETDLIENLDIKMSKDYWIGEESGNPSKQRGGGRRALRILKVNCKDRSKFSKKISDDKIVEEDDKKSDDFSVVTEVQNGGRGLNKKREQISEKSFTESGGTGNDEKENYSSQEDEFFEGRKQMPPTKLDEEGLRIFERNFDNRSKIIENGRWGMNSGYEPPREIKENIFRSEITENNGEREFERNVKEKRKKLGEDILNGRWGMSGSKPPVNFLEDIISNDKNIDEKLHSDLLIESGHEKSKERIKNVIQNSENEYWMKKDPRQQRTSENSRRTLNTEDLEEPVKNNKKYHEFNSNIGIPKLIQIIISPYAIGFKNGIESISIDQLIPDRNELDSTVVEIQPIVIGLSRKIRDKRR